MAFISPDVVLEAKQMDLLTYLQMYEPNNLVRVSNETYCTKEHDSLKISNGKWMWFSRGFGGFTALDYLIKVKYNKKYVLKNNNDAECIIENNILRIIHKDDVIYDLWTFQDNAFQLLFPVSNMSIKFSVKLYSPSELRNPTHFGIFISLEDQSKILFGNEGNYKISILNTSIPQNPNIYTKDYYSLNESILKIEINNNIGQFYIRDLKTEDWELIFSTEFDCNVNFIGIFSKTWEYTKQISEFSNLNLEINSKIIFQSNDWGSILHEKEL